MNDVKEIKKRVKEDWLTAFPQLSAYTQNKFYKICGPLLAGIDLINNPRTGNYRPHFVFYPLWNNDIDECMRGPILLLPLKNKKGRQLDISYAQHEESFPEASDQVRSQLPISLDGDIFIKDLFVVMDNYSKMPPLDAAPNSFLQAKQQEYRLEIAMYGGSDDQVKNIFDQIQNKNWDISHFELWNIKLGDWLEELQQKMNHKDEFLARIERNKSDKKFEKFKKSDIKP